MKGIKIKKRSIFFSIISYLILVRKNNFPLSEMAILFSLSEEQRIHFISAIGEAKFNNKFPIEKLRYKKLYIIGANAQQVQVLHNTVIVQINNPLLFVLIMVLNYQKKFTFHLFKILLQSIVKIEKNIITNIITIILNEIQSLDIFETISVQQNYPREFKIDRNRRKFETHVIHYSQQNLHFIKENEKKDPKNYFLESIFNKNSLGDTHWVWTESYARYLRAINPQVEVKPVGSITFQLQPEKYIPKSNKIVIFDVSISEEYEFNNYLLTENFFHDIIKAVEGKFELYLKPKRGFYPGHHLQKYIDFILDLQSKGQINILDPLTNPYELIMSAKLAISSPFTTIAYIGREVGTDTIFYRPYLEKLKNLLYEDQVPVIYGYTELKNYINKI